MSTEGKTYRKAKPSDIIKIHEELKDLIKHNEDDEYVHYVGGETDDSVAQRLSVSPSSVAMIRKQMFGQLRPYRAVGSASLEMLANAERRMSTLEDRFNRLLQNMKVNKLIDSTHLTITQEKETENVD